MKKGKIPPEAGFYLFHFTFRKINPSSDGTITRLQSLSEQPKQYRLKVHPLYFQNYLDAQPLLKCVSMAIFWQIVYIMSSLFDVFPLNRFRSLAKPIELSGGYPVAQCFKNLNLVDIARVMREKKLIKGAEIMEHWFLGKPFFMPTAWKAGKNAPDPRTIPKENINDTIITMQWALGFPRALSVYNELKSAVYGNLTNSSLEASQLELFRNLKQDGKFTKNVEQFGFGDGRTLHKTAHINTRTIGTNFSEKLSDPLDDMYCALGAFGIHMAGAGAVTPLDPKAGNGTHQVKIEKLGFYIKDTYDFNDDQALGYWSDEGVTKSAGPGSSAIENKSFRDWRTRFNHGGDFMVFSNVRWEGVAKPIIWNHMVV